MKDAEATVLAETIVSMPEDSKGLVLSIYYDICSPLLDALTICNNNIKANILELERIYKA